MMKVKVTILFLSIAGLALGQAQTALPIAKVEGQPLGANVSRLVQAMEFLGMPLAKPVVEKLNRAIRDRDEEVIQRILDPHVLVAVSLNPEVRVKVRRGPAKAMLRQGGYTSFVVKVFNDSTVARPLRVTSPQAGPIYSGAALGILKRQAQTELKVNENVKGEKGGFSRWRCLTNRQWRRRSAGLRWSMPLS